MEKKASNSSFGATLQAVSLLPQRLEMVVFGVAGNRRFCETVRITGLAGGPDCFIEIFCCNISVFGWTWFDRFNKRKKLDSKSG